MLRDAQFACCQFYHLVFPVCCNRQHQSCDVWMDIHSSSVNSLKFAIENMFQCKYHLYQSSFVHSPELVCKHDSHVTGILKADWPDVKNKTINSHATKNGPYVCLSVCLSACIFQRPNDQTSPNLCALHVAGVTHGSVIL